MSARLTAGTTNGPNWYLPHDPQPIINGRGNYCWQIQWNLDQSTGYVVQEIYSEIHQIRGLSQSAPEVMWSRYWEAWQVTGLGELEGGGFDVWTIELGQCTRGWWLKRGVAYWVTALDNPSTWSRTNVRDSHGLLAKRSRPANLGHALCRREVRGHWRGTGPGVASNFHREIPRGQPNAIPELVGHTAAVTH